MEPSVPPLQGAVAISCSDEISMENIDDTFESPIYILVLPPLVVLYTIHHDHPLHSLGIRVPCLITNL